MNARTLRKKPRGLTLLELLVVLTVIGFLTSLLLPAVQQARESARRACCLSNQREWGLAFHEYEEVHGAFPAGYSMSAPARTFVPDLLPQIEQASLAFDLQRNWDDPTNRAAVATHLSVMLCPSAPDPERFDAARGDFFPAAGDYAPTHGVNPGYCQIMGWAPFSPPTLNGVLTDRPCRLAEIRDGLSETLLLVEDAGRPELWRMGRRATGQASNAGWADPDFEIALDGSDLLTTGQGQSLGPCAMNCTNDNEAYSFHPGGVNLLFADASAHFLSDTVDAAVFAALSTKACREVVSP